VFLSKASRSGVSLPTSSTYQACSPTSHPRTTDTTSPIVSAVNDDWVGPTIARIDSREIVPPGVGGHPAAEQSCGLGRAQETVVGQVFDRPAPVVGAEAEGEAAVSGDDLQRRLHRAQGGRRRPGAGGVLRRREWAIGCRPLAVDLERGGPKAHAGNGVSEDMHL